MALRTIVLPGVLLQVKKWAKRTTTSVVLKKELAVPTVRNCAGMAYGKGDSIFRQLLDYNTFTYTYLLADNDSKEAVLIDPVLQMVDRDIKLAEELGVRLIYGINTHMHADHITGTGVLKKRLKNFNSVIAKQTSAKADVYVDDGHIIKFGKFQLECRSTPGHTDGCMSYVWHEKGMAFTGDTLLIRGCGRTDFQQGRTVTSVAEEKKWNLRLTKPLSEFVQIMDNLNLAPPKFLDEAVPANLNDGIVDEQKQKTTK